MTKAEAFFYAHGRAGEVSQGYVSLALSREVVLYTYELKEGQSEPEVKMDELKR